MIKIFKYIFGSLDNNNTGASARKLSGFAAVLTAIFLSVKHSNETNVENLVITWLLFGAVCFGIITIAEIIKLRNNKSEDKPEETKV